MRGQRRRGRGGAAVPSMPAAPTPLDGLLDDVRDLRLTLASDLSLAAGAADAGAVDVTRDIIESDQRELARFARAAELRLARLQGVVVPEPRAPRWRRRLAASLPAVPLVGAMALSAAAATGVLPLPTTTSPHRATPVAVAPSVSAPVDSTFQQFVTLVDGYPSAKQVLAAAAVLHRQLADLIAASTHDPSSVREIEQLLQMEQSLLLRRQPPGSMIVLEAAHQLAARLDTVAKPTVSATSTLLPTPVTSTHRPRTTRTSPAPTPTAAKTSSPQPAATPPPTAAPTPAPTTSPSSNQIPGIPG